MVPIGCNKHVGALLEGRAWHKELEDELGSIVVTAHHFKGSAAAQAGHVRSILSKLGFSSRGGANRSR